MRLSNIFQILGKKGQKLFINKKANIQFFSVKDCINLCVCEMIKFQIYKVIGSVNFFFLSGHYAPREITGDILEQLQQHWISFLY